MASGLRHFGHSLSRSRLRLPRLHFHRCHSPPRRCASMLRGRGPGTPATCRWASAPSRVRSSRRVPGRRSCGNRLSRHSFPRPRTNRVCRPPADSTITRAPTTSPLFAPRRSMPTQRFSVDATFRRTATGSFRWLTTRSVLPSLSRSPNASAAGVVRVAEVLPALIGCRLELAVLVAQQHRLLAAVDLRREADRVAADDDEVLPAVEVVVEETRAPAHVARRRSPRSRHRSVS